MPQTPALTYSDDGAIDYTPSLQTEGIYKLPKTTAAVVRGLPIHWDPTGSPDSGTASSGAANQLGVGTYAGLCVEASASGDDYAIVDLNVPTNLFAVTAVTAAGSVIGDAAQLSQGINVVTGADGTKGVILPTAVPGMQVIVKGVTAGILKVWPKTGATINALSASAALSMTTGAMPLTFVATSATQWYTLPLVAS